MDEVENKSEVARFREQQALKEQAARLALYGYAETTRHAFVQKRAEIGAERILRLIEEGKGNEAMALMNTDNWGVAEEEVAHGQAHPGC